MYSAILIKIVYISFEKLIFKQCPSYGHFSSNYIAVVLKRATFSNPPRAETLLFLQIGFTTVLCHHSRSIVAFDSRSKTSIHVSPFPCHAVALAQADRVFDKSSNSNSAKATADKVVSSLWHCPARIPCSIEGGRYPLSVYITRLCCGVRTFLTNQDWSDHIS